MTDAGEKLAERVNKAMPGYANCCSMVETFLRAELERAAEIADDCQCDRSAKCSCADHAAAIRKLKE